MAKKLFGAIAAVALAGGVMFALVGPASAGVDGTPTLTINVHKAITGSPSVDQTFTVQVVCTNPGDDPTVSPSTNQSITWDQGTGTFSPSNATRTFTIPTRFENGEEPTTTCTVSETNVGTSTSHTIECTSESGDATCDSNSDQVTIPYASEVGGTANLTVTNNFSSTPATTTTTIGPAVTTLPPATTTTKPAPKPAAQPVVAPAHFTG